MAQETDLIAGGNTLAAGKYLQGNQITVDFIDFCQRLAETRADLGQFVVPDIGGSDSDYIAGD